ncbi:uncharacterized protein Dyak_GE27996, partial [Drosophila yakuba]
VLPRVSGQTSSPGEDAVQAHILQELSLQGLQTEPRQSLSPLPGSLGVLHQQEKQLSDTCLLLKESIVKFKIVSKLNGFCSAQ